MVNILKGQRLATNMFNNSRKLEKFVVTYIYPQGNQFNIERESDGQCFGPFYMFNDFFKPIKTVVA